MGGRGDIVQAAMDGRIDIVKLVLQHTPEKVNDQDNHGFTALHFAAWISSLELAEVLLAANANVDIKNNMGSTALHKCAEKNSFEVAKVLVAANANVDILNSDGDTALHAAAANRMEPLEVAEVLVAANANLDFKSKAGATALEYAKEYKNHGIATMLSSQ